MSDYVAELYETLTTTPREVLRGIRDELTEEEPEALHTMLLEKEDKETNTKKEKQRKQFYALQPVLVFENWILQISTQ